jgi:hypothetical protein
MGCSLSQHGTSVVRPKTLTLDHTTVSSLIQTDSQSTRMIENCLIIWLYDQPSNTFEKEKEQLRNLVYGLHIFHNIDTCISFIAHIRDEKIFLILSGTYRSTERFHHLSQLEKVYLFDFSSRESSEDIDSLYKQLQQDIKLCEMDLIPITAVPVSSEEISLSSNLTKHNASFFFAQILKEVIYRLKFESGSKDVFIDFCRSQYANCKEQLRIIDEFARNYRPNKAVWWLTNQCFISHILNRVQRTREIDLIYKLGFFMKHLNIQLNHLHEENKLLMETISTVYRGKTMSCNEFDTFVKNNSDGLLSFNNFLISTTNKQVAVDFVCRRLLTHPDMTGVVFEIHIDHTIFNERSPFALLKDTDMVNDDICFYMDTVFRIESVEQIIIDAVVIWLVKLIPINDDDQQLNRFTAPARNDDVHVNPLTYLGKFLLDMGEYRRAEQFFLAMLQDTSVRSQPRRLVRVHNGLGAIYTFNREYGKALQQYQQVLQTSLVYLQSDHIDLASIYKSIGDSYLNQSNFVLAVQNYEKAIELLEQSTQQIHSQIITDLHTLLDQARQSIKSNN